MAEVSVLTGRQDMKYVYTLQVEFEASSDTEALRHLSKWRDAPADGPGSRSFGALASNAGSPLCDVTEWLYDEEMRVVDNWYRVTPHQDV